MAFKRIIGTLTVKDGQLVKSYGYATWRPAGSLVTALKNLDRWGVDEIVVLDISRRDELSPSVLKQIGAAKASTPIAYGGGIRNARHVRTLMDSGCDRFVLESLLFSDGAIVQELADITGRQALIASLPVRLGGNERLALWRPGPPNSVSPRFEALDDHKERLLSLPVSEYFVTAVDAEGHAGTFPRLLPVRLEFLPRESVIWFGGLDSSSAVECLQNPVTTAVAFGNGNHERELNAAMFRERVLRSHSAPVRTNRLF